MKILIFSDLHVHNWTYGATQIDGWNSRLLVQEKFLDHLANVAAEEDIDVAVFCGDLFHQHGQLTADVLQVAYEGFRTLGNTIPDCYALVGNHDFQTSDGDINSLSFLHGAKWNVAFPNTKITIQGKKFFFISYTPHREVFEGY